MCICCFPVLVWAAASWGLLKITPSLWQGTGEDDSSQPFTSFSPFRSARTAFGNVEFSLDVKDNIIVLLILLCLLCAVFIMFRDEMKVSREVVQQTAPWVDSHEWDGMWGGRGQVFGGFLSSNGLEVHS